jgi:hypothetical protein
MKPNPFVQQAEIEARRAACIPLPVDPFDRAWKLPLIPNLNYAIVLS